MSIGETKVEESGREGRVEDIYTTMEGIVVLMDGVRCLRTNQSVKFRKKKKNGYGG